MAIEQLNRDWLTEGSLDFEYKKYILLAYLKHVSEKFGEQKLYPPLGDLVMHYRKLSDLKHSLESLNAELSKNLVGIDLLNMKLRYSRNHAQDNNLLTIQEIIDFALPSIREHLEQGKSLYDAIEKEIQFEPVGVIPVYTAEGYLFLALESNREVWMYRFQSSALQLNDEKYRSLSFSFIGKELRSLGNSFEQMKIKLLNKIKELPNPATFLCYSRRNVPLNETLLPVGKRLLMQHISA